jgi:hypothetical protein
MIEQESQELLRDSRSVCVKECATPRKTWFSVGFIFGYKLRQAIVTRDESSMELYLLHLRRVSEMRDGSGEGVVERAAWLCGTYAMKELETASRQLAGLRQQKK